MTEVRVHLDSPDGPVPVGTAWITRMRGIDSTEFTYESSYLSGPGWAISPDLPLGTGGAVVEGLPGALDDSAPDSWGRNLITRHLASLARDAGHGPPTPTEVDYLLGVNDSTRQGALRFCKADGQAFLAEGSDIPNLVELEALLDAAKAVSESADADEAVATLLTAGSGSLGGARPKASVTDGTTFYVAKFPHTADSWDVIRWEAVALDLAQECGLRTPAHELIEVGSYPVLLVERFDRNGTIRIPYLSARSLTGERYGDSRDYLELVDSLADHGSDVSADLVELWRRIAFSVAINNTDDHHRNHGVLRAPGGWTLSPLFDVNPDPRSAAPRVTSLAGATTANESRRALLDTANHFGLDRAEARRLWAETLEGVSQWRAMAARHEIDAVEMDRFAPVLDRWASTGS